MKKSLTLTLTTFFMLFLVIRCDQPQSPDPASTEFGYLSLSVGLQIEESPAGRIEAVSPDNFIVTVYNVDDGSIVEQWNTYLEVPEQAQLPTGTYYVTATNLAEPADAAFEQPWYYGESEVFTIDKEELKTISVLCTLANCKISFNYSQNVLDNFTTWNATATIDDGNGTGAFLEWLQSDPEEGYFLTDFSIDVEVFLEYIKLTDPDQSITRTFNHTIPDPQPATHYLVNVDASLEDGKIIINITVNDEFETVEIELGDGIDPNATWIPGEPWVDQRDGYAYRTVQVGDQTWFAENLRATDFTDGEPIQEIIDPAQWPENTTPAYSWYNNDQQSNAICGPLYNWFVVESGKACPSGWHVPTREEWLPLLENAGGLQVAGNSLKEVGRANWIFNNTEVTNSLGFTALPGGFIGNSGISQEKGFFGHFWTVTVVSSINDPSTVRFWGSDPFVAYMGAPKNYGLSIRCLKD